jgi:hypothetical protein
MEIEDLLKQIAQIMGKLQIPYAVTGGMAVSVWGRTRSTADIDIVVQLIPKNIDALAKELLAIDKDVYISKEVMQEALKLSGEFNFIHPQSGLKVDFWVAKDRFNEQEILHGVAKDFEGQEVIFVSPEDLILSKLLWYELSQSTRQLEDIESILRISEVDLKYVRNWAKKQKTLEILERLVKKIKLHK